MTARNVLRRVSALSLRERAAVESILYECGKCMADEEQRLKTHTLPGL